MEEIRDVVGSCRYTYRLMAEIADVRKKQAVATIAETYQLGYKLVDRKNDPIKVKHIGIDEISLHAGQGNYILVLTDLEKRIVLDILPNRLKQTLEAWLKKPPTGIDLAGLEIAAIDLWSQYREARSCL